MIHVLLVAGEVEVRLLHLQLAHNLLSVWIELFVCTLPVMGRVGWVGDGLTHLFDVRGGVGVLAAKDGRRVVLAVEDPVAGGIDQVRVDPVACLVVINLAGDGIFERTDRALVHVPVEFALGDVGASSQAAAGDVSAAVNRLHAQEVAFLVEMIIRIRAIAAPASVVKSPAFDAASGNQGFGRRRVEGLAPAEGVGEGGGCAVGLPRGLAHASARMVGQSVLELGEHVLRPVGQLPEGVAGMEQIDP